MCVFMYQGCMSSGVLDALYVLTDLANLLSLECLGNSNCILDRFSRELIHGSLCEVFVQFLP